jgi:hypothetical protein
MMFILDIYEEQHVEIQRNIMDKIQEDIQMMYSQMIMQILVSLFPNYNS